MTYTDTVAITGVKAFGYHGVEPEEREQGQEFFVDVAMDIDVIAAANTDELDKTVNYADVAADAVAVIEGPAMNLIETVATAIADKVVRRSPVVAVKVTVHKPNAPVGVPFSDVKVTIRRYRPTPVVIALGANLDHPEQALVAAMTELSEVMTDLRVSKSYHSYPVGGPEQPDYLNAVAIGSTTLSPERLLAQLQRIEEAHGRRREVRWGPRTLDLDIISMGEVGTNSEVRCQTPALTLPHTLAHERAFVVLPWAEVDPDALLRLPTGEVASVNEMATELSTDGVRTGAPLPWTESKREVR